METLNLKDVYEFVNENIDVFHQKRLASLEKLSLSKLLRKNPYLFKAKNVMTAGELMNGLLNEFLSSSEEKMFGDFLEDLAIFIAAKTCNGHKSSARGVDLEFVNNNTHFVVSIKSDPNWGNSSQRKKLSEDLREAVIRLKQSNISKQVQPVLGICYGKTKTVYTKGGYIKIVGQNFWYFISDNVDLYTDIIEPIGYRAKERNDAFEVERSKVVNRLTKRFIEEFCQMDGAINWKKLVQYNSGNLDRNQVLFFKERFLMINFFALSG